ncbi:MAG TPA: glycosyltransferase family 87 protein [Ramlibacter sp.]|jgi:uncharacterized membrane protein YvlD (DUF360 family)|uniref:glycosyltransferase family 87 protein n=1 Tax=Ramlibacter sp. TaxID=1917967 RepID=UPI002D59A073|nr:glycosyltransferase family 87 protein [Ramlibacter sp.]HZY18413.1 glycosyltransferase family 87 protein [Ramlibacter sp.]
MAFLAHLLATALGLLVIHRLASTPTLDGWKRFVMTGSIAVVAVLAVRASDPPDGFLFNDFRIAYYPAGRAVLEDPQRLQELLDKGVSGFVNLPAVAWLLAPLAALAEERAVLVFTALGVAAAVGAWWLLCRVARLGLRERYVLALLFAGNGPLLYSLKEGNTSHMVLFGLVAGLALLRGGRPLAAGAVLAVCAVVKPPLALFGLFFLLRRDLAGLTGFAVVGAGFALASVLLAGWTLNQHWFELSVLKFSREWLAAFNVQSLPAFVLRLDPGAQQHLHVWATLTGVGDGERMAGELLRAAVFLAAAFAWRRAATGAADAPAQVEQRRDLQFLLVLCLALVTSPLAWSHYYAWLLVPIAFLLGPTGLGQGRAARVLGWVAIVLAMPLVRPLFFTDPALAAAYRSIGVSHLLFGGLLTFGLVAAHLAASGPTMRGRAMEPGRRPRPWGAAGLQGAGRAASKQ